MSEANKATMRRFYEAVVAGDFAAMEALVAPDVLDHVAMGAGMPPGREGFLAHVQALRGGFPDLSITVEDMVAEGDRVVTFWRARGTHLGPFLRMPPTGKAIEWLVIDIARLRDGHVVEYFPRTDRLLVLQQMGATITPPAAAD